MKEIFKNYILEKFETNKDNYKKNWNNKNIIQTKHLIIDNLLPKKYCEKIFNEFPLNKNNFTKFNSFREKKKTSSLIKKYNPIISGQLSREEIELSSKDENRPLQIKSSDIEISNDEKKIKKYIPLSKRQDKPDSALWLIKQHNILKDSQIAKLVGITKNSVTSIRNKSYWNFNNLNPKDPVALNLFTQKDLIEAIAKAERRIKREKKEKEKQAKANQPTI